MLYRRQEQLQRELVKDGASDESGGRESWIAKRCGLDGNAVTRCCQAFPTDARVAPTVQGSTNFRTVLCSCGTTLRQTHSIPVI